jgi:hypothetical protein
VDHLARGSMKNAANCASTCELQDTSKKPLLLTTIRPTIEQLKRLTCTMF